MGKRLDVAKECLLERDCGESEILVARVDCTVELCTHTHTHTHSLFLSLSLSLPLPPSISLPTSVSPFSRALWYHFRIQATRELMNALLFCAWRASRSLDFFLLVNPGSSLKGSPEDRGHRMVQFSGRRARVQIDWRLDACFKLTLKRPSGRRQEPKSSSTQKTKSLTGMR